MGSKARGRIARQGRGMARRGLHDPHGLELINTGIFPPCLDRSSANGRSASSLLSEENQFPAPSFRLREAGMSVHCGWSSLPAQERRGQIGPQASGDSRRAHACWSSLYWPEGAHSPGASEGYKHAGYLPTMCKDDRRASSSWTGVSHADLRRENIHAPHTGDTLDPKHLQI